MPLIIAMTPTWNEAANIGPLMDALLALNDNGQLPEGCRLEVLVVDDNSPDGTWHLVRERAAGDARIHLLHRLKDKGRGLAGIAGFREALRLNAEYVIEMDADFSHDPRWIPSMVRRALEPPGHAVVIGSRLVPGGGEEGRHGIRRLITLAANAYIRFMLRLPVRDATSGYRLFSRACLEALPWGAMRATGPEVVQEVLLAAHTRGFRMAEVPILFVERRAGKSSFNFRIMLRSLLVMWRLRFMPGELTPPRPEEPPINLPKALALPLSWLYSLGRRGHRALYLLGILRRNQLPVPVVCVGNISVGGTGKTPMVCHVVQQLNELGHHPAILSRGYGAAERIERPLIVADEHRRLASPDEAGDEPCLLASLLPGTPVVAHRSRYRAGRLAIERFKPDILVLDDGFQHDALQRDIDIVLWDGRDRMSKQRLLPLGRLREPITALRRASAIIVTHMEYLPEAGREERLQRGLANLTQLEPRARDFVAETRISGWRRLSGTHGKTGDTTSDEMQFPWAGQRVILVAGLARPTGFEVLVRRSGGQVLERLFYPDHHIYTREEVMHWHGVRQRLGADYILTTEKDAVKLNQLALGGLQVLAVQITLEVAPPEQFRLWLREQLELASTRIGARRRARSE